MSFSEKSKRQAAISLLEMLLAVSLLVVISSLVGVVLFQAQKTKQSTDNELKARQNVRLIKNLMERDIKSVVYLANYGAAGYNSGLLGIDRQEGSSEVNQLYMHVQQRSLNNSFDDYSQDPHLHEVAYYLRRSEKNPDYYSLYRREKFFIRHRFELVNNIYDAEPEINYGDQSTYSLLIYDQITSLKIEYLATANNARRHWSSLDTPDQPLPQAIRVNLSLVNDGGLEQIIKFQVNIRPPIKKTIWRY